MADRRFHLKGGIVVSEFGLPEPYESSRTDLHSIVIDPLRSRYYREYMRSILMAMAEGINVVGTLAWSILDNFGTSSPQASNIHFINTRKFSLGHMSKYLTIAGIPRVERY